MLDLQVSAKTVAITDYHPINANVAKVVISTTGDVDQEDLQDAINDQLDGQGALVAKSIRRIAATNVTATYVGFVKSVSEVKEVTDKEIRAGYHAILASNANVLVSSEDQSVWELKTGAGGKYLVRHAEEDLTNLVASVVNHSTTSPRLNHIGMPLPKPTELLAYVTPEGNLDYGFVTKVSSSNECVQVMSLETQSPRIVNNNVMASAYSLDIDPEIHKLVSANISREAKDKQISYYRTLFAYAPDYLEKVIEMVEGSGD